MTPMSSQAARFGVRAFAVDHRQQPRSRHALLEALQEGQRFPHAVIRIHEKEQAEGNVGGQSEVVLLGPENLGA